MTSPYTTQTHRPDCGCSRPECQMIRKLTAQIAQNEAEDERQISRTFRAGLMSVSEARDLISREPR